MRKVTESQTLEKDVKDLAGWCPGAIAMKRGHDHGNSNKTEHLVGAYFEFQRFSH